jgi:hypothetical protein
LSLTDSPVPTIPVPTNLEPIVPLNPDGTPKSGTQILLQREADIERRTKEWHELMIQLVLSLFDAPDDQLTARLRDVKHQIKKFQANQPKGVVLL